MELETERSSEQAATSNDTSVSGRLTNVERVHWFRYESMMHCYRNDREAEAFNTAEDLLLVEDLPLLIRARCHMVLCTNDEHPFFVQHAEEAVRVLDVDCRERVLPEAFPEKQLAEAKRLLDGTREIAQEKATEASKKARKAAKKARRAAAKEAGAAKRDVDQAMADDEGEEAKDSVGDLPGVLPAHSAQQIRDALRSGPAGMSGGARSTAGAPTPPASKGTSRTSSRELQQAASKPARSMPAPTPPSSRNPSLRATEGAGSSAQPTSSKPSLAPLSIPRIGDSTTEPTPRTQVARSLSSLSFGSMPSAAAQAQEEDEDEAMEDADEAGDDDGEA